MEAPENSEGPEARMNDESEELDDQERRGRRNEESEEEKPSVNFINVIRAAFARSDPESAKKTVKLSVFFALLGSDCTKAAPGMLIKLTPGVNFINVLRAAFGLVDLR